MSEIIKQINVDGVDYDIVSESAEKKIAELEKNNTALASITIGTRDDLQNPVKVGLGERPIDFDITKDIFIDKSVSLSAGGGVIIGTGSDCPLEMKWNRLDNSFTITGGYGFNTIKIGSDAITYDGVVVVGTGGSSSISGAVQIDSGSELRMSSAVVRIDDSCLTLNREGLRFGTQGWIGNNISIAMYGDAVDLRNGGDNLCQLYAQRCEVHIGSIFSDGNQSLKVAEPTGTLLEIGARVTIGKDKLPKDHLTINGPVYLEAATSETYLVIGTNDEGCLKIDWGESDKIVFTNLQSGKKATLTLS